MKDFYDMKMIIHPDDAHYPYCNTEDKKVVLRIDLETKVSGSYLNHPSDYIYLDGVKAIAGFEPDYHPEVFSGVLPTNDHDLKIIKDILYLQSLK